MMKRLISSSYLGILLVLLYAPILIVIIYSFTEAKVLGNWTGFSTKLYTNIFTLGAQHTLTKSLINTFIIGIIVAFTATILGTMAAIGIFNLQPKTQRAVKLINTIPILNPDIITAISLFLLFVSLGVSQGYTTVILAHISFCTPYVVLSVLPRLQRTNTNLYEAALDLGATPFVALRRVMLPELRPGMISGFILAFTLSIDDFVVTLFTKGNDGLETLSTYIYADARKGGLTPELRSLSALIFITVLAVLLIINYRAAKQKQTAANQAQ